MSDRNNIYLFVGGISTLVILLMLISFPLAFFALINEINPGLENITVSIPIFLFGYQITTNEINNIALGFSILSIIYLAIFVRTILFTLIKSININKKFSKNSINNKACIFAVLFVMCFFIVNVMEFIQTNMGIQTGNIQENSYIVNLFQISLAPITEEIGFRLSTLGLFTFLILKTKLGAKEALIGAIHPISKINKLEKSKAEYYIKLLYAIAIIIGIYFGIAHIIYSSNWLVGKAIIASFLGIIIGLVYIHYGFGMAILLHWSFNYLLYVYVYYDSQIWIFNNLYQIISIVFNMSGLIMILLIILNFNTYRNYLSRYD